MGVGGNPPGAPTSDFAKISENLHEIEKIIGHGGGVTHLEYLPYSLMTPNLGLSFRRFCAVHDQLVIHCVLFAGLV